MKIKDCQIGAKVAITSALKPSSTTLLALSNSVIVGHPFKASNGLYRVEVRDAEGSVWVLPINRITLIEETIKLRMGEAI